MRALEPDVLILLGGYGIVKEPLLSLAAHGVVSYHHGDMRRYRGMPPAFWELYNGERQMGVTVQRLGASLDAGEPIVERTVAIRDEDTVRSLRKRAMDGSVDMLFEAVQRLEQPAFRPAQIDTFGPLYTLPTLRQWLTVTARVGARRLRALARRL
jgi:methionyl-tRNA formyltransferase